MTPLPLLLFHGLLSSPQEFGLIAHTLKSRGLRFESPIVPGYTLENDAISPSWQRWRDAASVVASDRVAPNQPVVLGGLCMGGVLAAAVALEQRQRIAGLVLISPTFNYDGWGLSPIRHLRHLAYLTRLDRFFSVAEREPYGVKSPKIRKWVIREIEQRAVSAVGPSRLPLRAVREGERMMAEVRSRLSELDCPLLVIHAREDEITRLESVQHLIDTLPQHDKELVVLDDSYHMVTIDNDRHKVAALLDGFVKRIEHQHLIRPKVLERLSFAPSARMANSDDHPALNVT
ncbi:MAG: alpha/beta fold hydrolase [Sterolibacterium sp.]|nr:alpha/beta fold hydrolase [Sterolibacterium sp.]